MIQALHDHTGRFGIIIAGREYNPEDPMIRRALEEAPHLFKKQARVGTADVETAVRTRRSTKR